MHSAIEHYDNALNARRDGEAIVSAETIDALALDAIAELLDNEWDSDLFDRVADCVRRSGRFIPEL